MQLFYVPHIHQEKVLSEEESTHAVKVLRLKNRDTIHLVDGLGGLYEATITDAHPKKCSFEVVKEEQEFGKRDFYIHLAIAPTKNADRIEWMLEKCTEIGIDEITFLQCEHSERKIVKMERLEKILVQAMKQSLKAYIPKINPLIKFSDFMKRKHVEEQLFIAHLVEGERQNLIKNVVNKRSYCILIGPEGDFSMNEVEHAIKSDFLAVSLGASRLRTETAGLVACHTFHLLNDLS